MSLAKHLSLTSEDYEPITITHTQAIEIFGIEEVREIANNKLENLRKSRRYYYNLIREWEVKEANCEEKDEWFFSIPIKRNERILKKIDSRIAYWEMFFKSKNKRTFLDLDTVRKNILIKNIMPYKYDKIGSNILFYKCLFHNEKTPSMAVFEKDNRFKCFGCGKSGSVIDIYMALHNCDVGTAIKSLV